MEGMTNQEAGAGKPQRMTLRKPADGAWRDFPQQVSSRRARQILETVGQNIPASSHSQACLSVTDVSSDCGRLDSSGTKLCGCGGQGQRWRSQGGRTESHLLPHKAWGLEFLWYRLCNRDLASAFLSLRSGKPACVSAGFQRNPSLHCCSSPGESHASHLASLRLSFSIADGTNESQSTELLGLLRGQGWKNGYKRESTRPQRFKGA